MSEPRSEGWHYVISEEFPRDFRFAEHKHGLRMALTISVVDGRFIVHRDGKELVDGDRPPA